MTKQTPVTIELDGETFELRPLGYLDYEALRAEVIRDLRFQRLKATIDIRNAMPPEMWKEEWVRSRDEAYGITTASPEQIKHWLDTIDGVAHCLYRQLMPNPAPGVRYRERFTVEELKTLLCQQADLALEAKAARDATLPQEAEGSGQ
jgi:hypothetical protein